MEDVREVLEDNVGVNDSGLPKVIAGVGGGALGRIPNLSLLEGQ